VLSPIPAAYVLQKKYGVPKAVSASVFRQRADIVLWARWNVAVSVNRANVSDLLWLIAIAQIRFRILLDDDESSFGNIFATKRRGLVMPEFYEHYKI
jgi:hypothetical protein